LAETVVSPRTSGFTPHLWFHPQIPQMVVILEANALEIDLLSQKHGDFTGIPEDPDASDNLTTQILGG